MVKDKEYRLKLMDHLTKEIETSTTNMMNFRIRSCFFVSIGPFILLSSMFIANPGKLNFPKSWNSEFEFNISMASLIFILIGYCVGVHESFYFRKINDWRECIIRLSNGEEISEGDLNQFIMQHNIHKYIHYIYIFIFILICIEFSLVIKIISYLNSS